MSKRQEDTLEVEELSIPPVDWREEPIGPPSDKGKNEDKEMVAAIKQSLSSDVEAFLAKGGTISNVPSRRGYLTRKPNPVQLHD